MKYYLMFALVLGFSNPLFASDSNPPCNHETLGEARENDSGHRDHFEKEDDSSHHHHEHHHHDRD